jgi:predicted Zn-dependent peptidase
MAVFERSTLVNGTRVLTAPIPSAQSVTCVVMFAAGSRYETPETNGIAHFAEHMFFKGTEQRPTARVIAGEIDGIGGEFNAFTGKEATGYYVKCAAETRDTALDVIADMLQRSKFDAEEIDREKGVIVEEMNMYFDTPRSYIGSVYERLLYGDQPLGWDIIGRKETVRGATRETFLSYLDRWYRPERMVIGVGGRLGDGLHERLEELFGGVEPRETGGPEPVALPADGSPVSVFTKQSDQAHLIVGARGYETGHPDRYAVQLLGTVLGGGMSSRLFTEVRERRGLAYYVYAAASTYADAGSLSAQAGVDITRIDDAITTIVAELRRIVDDAVPADELEKARNFAKGRFVLGLESPYGTIMYGLRREVLEGRAREPEEVLAGLDAVTAEDVQRVARDILGGKLFLAVIGPFDDPARFEPLVAI